MTSKKPASSKRTAFPRAADYTRKFVKDWDRLSDSGRFNMRQLKDVMLLLIANDAPLGPEWLDHPLTGEWSDHRECHIGGDFLLIYQHEGKGAGAIVRFVRTGTHADLFEELPDAYPSGGAKIIRRHPQTLVQIRRTDAGTVAGKTTGYSHRTLIQFMYLT